MHRCLQCGGWTLHYSKLPKIHQELINLLNHPIPHGDGSSLQLNSLDTLVERLRKEIMEGKDETKDQLLSIVLSSRFPQKETRISPMCASNALSILNLSGLVSFAGMDFHDIKAPGADLSNAVLHKTNLNGANLEGASLAWAYLAEADLRGANLEEVNFGEKPSLSLPENYKYKVHWNSEGTSVAFIHKNLISSYTVDNLQQIQLKQFTNLKLDIFAWNTKAKVAVVAAKKIQSGVYILRFYDLQENGRWKKRGTDCKTEKQIERLVYNPEGTMLASADWTGKIVIWREGKEVKRIPAPQGSNQGCCIAWSPDGKKFVSSSENKARIWKVADNPEWEQVKTIENVMSGDWGALAWSPDSKKIATVLYSSGNVGIFSLNEEAEEPSLLYELKTESRYMWAHKLNSQIMSIAWNPRNPLLAASLRNGQVIIWSIEEGKEQKQVAIVSNSFHAVDKTRTDLAWNNDGTLLAWRIQKKGIHFWDTKTGRREVDPQGHLGSVTGLSFNEEGTQLASSSEDRTARIWDAATGEEVKKLPFEYELSAISWFKKKLAIGGSHNSLSIYDSETWNLEKSFRKPQEYYSEIKSINWDSDGKLLATINNINTTTKIRNTTDWKSLDLQPSLGLYQSATTSASWSPNGKTLAVGDRQGYVELWNLDLELWNVEEMKKQWNQDDWGELGTGSLELTSKNKVPQLRYFEHDGQINLSKESSNYKDLNILKTDPHEEVKEVSMVSVCGKEEKDPKKNALAVTHGDHITVYWDIKNKDENKKIKKNHFGHGLCWILGGKGLITGTVNGKILWWDINHHTLEIKSKAEIASHNAPVASICWNTKGKKLACCYCDGVIQVYQFRQKEQDFILLWRSGHKGLVLTDVQTSPSQSKDRVNLLKENFSS